jgi:hypothetical protein
LLLCKSLVGKVDVACGGVRTRAFTVRCKDRLRSYRCFRSVQIRRLRRCRP